MVHIETTIKHFFSRNPFSHSPWQCNLQCIFSLTLLLQETSALKNLVEIIDGGHKVRLKAEKQLNIIKAMRLQG